MKKKKKLEPLKSIGYFLVRSFNNWMFDSNEIKRKLQFSHQVAKF